MVAAATLFIALLAASSQAIASHNAHHGRSLHDSSHHHLAAVVRDHVSPNVGGPLAKRHESNKKRTNTKRARRCKPKPKPSSLTNPTSTKTKTSTPTKNTTVEDKDDDPKDDPKPPKSPPKTPPKKDDPKDDDPKDDDPKGDTFSGDGTFYSTGLNACGTVDKDSDFIAAVSHEMFDTIPGHTANPNKSPICQRKVRAHYKGKSVVVRITDKCAGCEIKGSLDFSPSAFKELADFDTGRIHGVTWSFIS